MTSYLREKIEELLSNPVSNLCIMMRHADKQAKSSFFGDEVGITDKGRASAIKVGNELGNHLGFVASSPLRRCVETANHIISNQKNLVVETNNLLGDPGALIEDAELAGTIFKTHELEEIADILISKNKNPKGFFASTKNALQSLVKYLLTAKMSEKQVNLFITHDIILVVFIAFYYQIDKTRKIWPDYLDYVLLWLENNKTYIYAPKLGKTISVKILS